MDEDIKQKLNQIYDICINKNIQLPLNEIIEMGESKVDKNAKIVVVRICNKFKTLQVKIDSELK